MKLRTTISYTYKEKLHVKELEKLVSENSINVNHLDEVTTSLKSEIKKLWDLYRALSAEIADIERELTENKKRDNMISSSVAKYTSKIQSRVDDKMDKEVSDLTYKKSEILKEIENSEIELREIITSNTSLENGITTARERKKEISTERESLEAEKLERGQHYKVAVQKLDQLEKELIGLREEEQKIIDVSGDSYSILQNYERKIKTLDEKERQLYREINGIEKESIAIKKDISNLSGQE
jgi:chromosome segregation protein